jgi:two-component system, cell cycle sensor histidine kinase and response regulator CckA
MTRSMDASEYQKIRQLLDDYLRMYSSRDDRLTTYFSEDFSGFTGGGDFLVKNREEWVAITRQDFDQIKDPIRIELKDLSIQSLADTIAVATSFFTIQLPIEDHVLSRETARLVLIFRKESAGWKISHSSISIPYYLVREGEIYPLKELVDRNQMLDGLIAERTSQLHEANDNLRRTNEKLAREIAEHKQAGDALQQSNQKIEAIASVSPDGIGIISLDGKIQFISDKLVKMHGYSIDQTDENFGKPVLDFIDSSCHELLMDNTRKVLMGQGNDKPTEYLAIKKDNHRFTIDVKSTVLLDSNGNPTGILYVERDITERKQAEADKEKLEAQNRQLQKAESLGRMAGAIAHHFNNQLGVVIGNLEMANEDLPQDARAVDSLTAAMQAAWKAAEVSGQMLTYLGETHGKGEPLDLSEVCRRGVPLLRAVLPGESILETELPSPGPTVNANANQIQQILTNLVTNAWEAVAEDGHTIRLRVKTVSPAEITLAHRYPIDWLPRDTAYACLEVTDEGGGIADKDIENIFDPFFSSKFTGRGLGLPVVLGIVKAHGGGVTVESRSGQGSIFRVFFPVSVEEVRRQPDKALQAPEMEGGGTVLLVDDEETVRGMAAAMLKRLGFSVLEAKDGVEAVEVFRQRQGEIRFVLCDLTMPRLNGWETMTALRKLSPDLPVILTSGYDKAQAMVGDHPELPQVFLGKPYKLKELGDAIRQALVGNAPTPGSAGSTAT